MEGEEDRKQRALQWRIQLGIFVSLKEVQVSWITRGRVIGDDLGEPNRSYAMDLGLYPKASGKLA